LIENEKKKLRKEGIYVEIEQGLAWVRKGEGTLPLSLAE